MSSVRLRRLTADHKSLSDYVRRHPRLRMIQAEGNPAERYQIEYRVSSIRQVDDQLTTVENHVVEIALPRNYPRTPPQCRMLSPVFHPNIAPHAICVGDHWSAGESLQSIVMRIGEILAYQSYNVKSPLNGEAARWVEEHAHELPLDRVSMILEESDTPPAPQPTRSAAPTSPPVPETRSAEPTRPTPPPHPGTPPDDDKVLIACPRCGKRYRVSKSTIGRTAACSQCDTKFSVTPSQG